MTELILNRDHYTKVIQGVVPSAEKFLWIATADIKDLHVDGGARKKMKPFLSVLSRLVDDGVSVRLIHAKEPGPRFREDFDKYPSLAESDLFERILCPRMHMKCIIADGRIAYVGSANLTGAGIGAKSAYRRNFEAGVLSDDPSIVNSMMEEIDKLYLGDFCVKCQRRDVCPDPIV